MATLVLSSIGTALGGPVGSAIGALIGQSIDQELLAPTRRGPRVGDLAVQTSSYGTQIARIYGTMRVAGSVIWSTDLVEHENTSGAKGAPDVTYSYTVSFAVALSSRPAQAVKRIWADGKLLRGVAGDFKVSTSFRFYDGSENQAIDPLIGSVEGIANTPAYRGLALAVFENLELAEFGNRIPFLTFELEADDVPATIGSILTDASAGAISCDATESVAGFAAYGASIRTAVEPLVDSFGVELFDDGTVLRSAESATPVFVDEDQLGNSTDTDSAARLHREQMPVRSVAAALRLTYYDPDRDYQTGEARALATEDVRNEAQRDLPAVLAASDAKALTQQMLARAWLERDKVTLRLPPRQLGLAPGSQLALPLSPPAWTVQKTTVDGLVVIADLRPAGTAAVSVEADGGRIVANSDVVSGPISVALLDVPNVLGLPFNQPTIMIAASTPTSGWKQRAVEIAFGPQTVGAQTARAKSILGQAMTQLAPGGADLIDDQNEVDVELIDSDQWLTSCDDDGLAAGTNLAVLGSELIQFGQATPLGGGRFRLSRLLRGRGGTEWASGLHETNDVFCLLVSGTVQAIALPGSTIGATISATITGEPPTSALFSGDGLRPPTPVALVAAIQSNDDLAVGWTRRSRLGFAWLDEIDAPLGETREQYRVGVTGTLGSLELLADQPNITIAAATLASLGAGPAAISVRQIGDFAVSRPADMNITLP